MKIQVGAVDWPRRRSSRADAAHTDHCVSSDCAGRLERVCLNCSCRHMNPSQMCCNKKRGGGDVGRKHGRWNPGPTISPITQAATTTPDGLPHSHPYFLSGPPLVPLSQCCSCSISPCLHFLQPTASWGTRVYFATCGDGSLPRPELAASCC